ncbi:MAG: hypothetical protein JKY37_23905 [Nannocystaceae bacterium]|nr:hypothetical protein [Nannocystaceae bacterium]
MATLGTEIDAAIVVAEATETVLADDATTAADLDSARPGLSLLRQALDLATTPRDRELLAATIAHPSVDITALGQTWAKHSTALALWSEPSELAECDILGREAAVMQSYAGRFGRFFSPTWWRSRGALRRALVQAWPQRAGAGFEPSFLREIQDRVEATRAWDQTRAAFEALGVPHLSPKDGAAAQGALAKLDEFAGLANRLPGTTTGLENLGLHLPTSTAALDATQANLARREAQLEAVDKLRGATQPIATRFPWVVDPSVATLRELCGHLRADGARLRESDGWWSQLDSAHAIGRPALDLVANALPDADATTWREALTRAWACAHLDTLRASVPQLAELGTTAEAQTVSRAAEAMRTLDLEPQTRGRHDSRAP